jgi:shikimate dehydrogenase
MSFSGAAMVAGVVGRPIRHSLSPLIHNAWIAAAGLDAVYAPFEVADDGFERFIDSLRDGGVRGLNVTLPYKARAFACADVSDTAARDAGAANLLVYRPDDVLEARNTDGLGLLEALARQAPQLNLAGARVLLLGAGGGARGAASALLGGGVGALTIVNRTPARAEALAAGLGGRAAARPWRELASELESVDLVVNATSAELGDEVLSLPWQAAPAAAVAMDMVYKPLRTPFLEAAAARGLATVDGLVMLIGQARPTFAALFGQAPPEAVDVRALALKALGEA